MRKNNKKDLLIGFIGQGFVGKNYADDFENRGYKIVRYSQEPEYVKNKDLIKNCDIVFVAVPTPTTPKGFDSSIVESTLKLIGKGKIVVIKSTIIPGTTAKLQMKFPSIFITHSPEFLSEKTAAHEASHPPRNIVGIVNPAQSDIAKLVLSVLPKAPYELICSSTEAEIIKYGKNCLGFFRILFTNIIYDLAVESGAEWNPIQEAMSLDPDNTPTYMNPIHKTGRGAGGRCFIKDFAIFSQIYSQTMPSDIEGQEVLKALEKKNISLLKASKKDLEILKQVYNE